MFGEMFGGEGYSGGQEWDCMEDLEEDLKAFGIKFEGWREAGHKVGRWFRRVEEGTEVFMRKWRKDKKDATAERHRPVATATLTDGANTCAREEISSRAHVLAPSVRVAVATGLCRSAVASFLSLRHFRMKTSVPSSTRRNHLPTLCPASRHPSNLMPNALRSSSRSSMQSHSCPPE